MNGESTHSGLSPEERRNWLGEVERVHGIGADAFRERYVATRTPVVVRGSMGDWRAMGWTAENLVERMGSTSVGVQVLDEKNVTRYETAGVQMSFADFISAIHDDPPRERCYLAMGNLWCAEGGRFPVSQFPLLRHDYAVPALLERQALLEVNLWIGYAGATSNLHFDPADNLLCMVKGTKRIRLYGPDQSARVYQAPVLRECNELHSPVDVADPDLARFPRFRRAKFRTVDLRPGEALFMPAGYWHYVRSGGFNIAINFWWKTPRWALFQFRSPMRAQWLRAAHETATRKAQVVGARVGTAFDVVRRAVR